MISKFVHHHATPIAFKPERTQRKKGRLAAAMAGRLAAAMAVTSLVGIGAEAGLGVTLQHQVEPAHYETVSSRVLSHAATEPVFCLLGWDERRGGSRAPSGERHCLGGSQGIPKPGGIARQPARCEAASQNQGVTGKNSRREPEKVVDVDHLLRSFRVTHAKTMPDS